MESVCLSGIEVIVFDLDDTLYPEQAFVFSGFNAVSRELQRVCDCPFDPAARMREMFSLNLRRRVFDTLLSELAIDPPPMTVDAMVELYRTHQPTISLFPDAVNALSRWSEGFRLALISDGPEMTQRHKVEALGLELRLDPIVLTGQWGESYFKPHLRAFKEVEQLTGAQGRSCVYIADNVAKDFVGPNQLGWQTVRVLREGGVYATREAPSDGVPSRVVSTLDAIEIMR